VPILEHPKVALWSVHIDLILQVNCHESHGDFHLMDLEIVLGGKREVQPKMAHRSSWGIRSLVVHSINMVISSPDQPGPEPLHIACSITLDLLSPVTRGNLAHFWKLHNISTDLMVTNCIQLVFHGWIPLDGQWRLYR
jgi:hypothetical protein